MHCKVMLTCPLRLKELCTSQGLGNRKEMAAQLVWIVTHLGLQHSRQGVGKAIFWRIHHAFLTARASSNYNMVSWAESYQMAPPAQQLPVVAQLSSQILEWAQNPPEHLQSQAAQPAHQIAAADDVAADAVGMDFALDCSCPNPGSPRLHFQAAHDPSLDPNSDSMTPMFDNGMVGQQLPVEDVNYHSSSLYGSPDALANDQEAMSVQDQEPNMEQILQSIMLEDLEDEGMEADLQAPSHIPDILGAMQASTSFQHGMLNNWQTASSQHGMSTSWPTAAASGSATTSIELDMASSTQEFTDATSATGELAQAGPINQNLDAGSRVADTTHPVSEPHITRARLRLALAAVRTTVDNDSWSLEHAQSLDEVFACLHTDFLAYLSSIILHCLSCMKL